MAEGPPVKWIELIICARCQCEIRDGGVCGFGCVLDGELRDARDPRDVISERYVLASTRKWSDAPAEASIEILETPKRPDDEV